MTDENYQNPFSVFQGRLASQAAQAVERALNGPNTLNGNYSQMLLLDSI